jgi:hypothetical protein
VTLPERSTPIPPYRSRPLPQGTVDEVFAAAGQAVATGDVLYDIKVETVRDPVETKDAMGNPVITQPKPLVTFEEVLAPSAGVLSS